MLKYPYPYVMSLEENKWVHILHVLLSVLYAPWVASFKLMNVARENGSTLACVSEPRAERGWCQKDEGDVIGFDL